MWKVSKADVLRGLSRPVAALSFEYLPPAHAAALEALNLVDRLGDYEYNYSPVETLRYAASTAGSALLNWRSCSTRSGLGRSGDVYARRVDGVITMPEAVLRSLTTGSAVSWRRPSSARRCCWALAAVAGVGPIGCWPVPRTWLACVCSLARAVGPNVVGLGPANLVTLTRAVLVRERHRTGGGRVATGGVRAARRHRDRGPDPRRGGRSSRPTDSHRDRIGRAVRRGGGLHPAPGARPSHPCWGSGCWRSASCATHGWRPAGCCPGCRLRCPPRHCGKAVAVLVSPCWRPQAVLTSFRRGRPCRRAGSADLVLRYSGCGSGGAGQDGSGSVDAPSLNPAGPGRLRLVITEAPPLLGVAVLIATTNRGSRSGDAPARRRGADRRPPADLPGRAGRVLAVIAGVVLGVSSMLCVLEHRLPRRARPAVRRRSPTGSLPTRWSTCSPDRSGAGGCCATLAAFAMIVTVLLVTVILAVRRSAAAWSRRTDRRASWDWWCRYA